jgi:hypothetical protein
VRVIGGPFLTFMLQLGPCDLQAMAPGARQSHGLHPVRRVRKWERVSLSSGMVETKRCYLRQGGLSECCDMLRLSRPETLGVQLRLGTTISSASNKFLPWSIWYSSFGSFENEN